MPATTERVMKDKHARASLEVVEELFGDIRPRDFAVRLWDGTPWGAAEPHVTLVLNHPGSLRAMLVPPTELTLGEAYVFGDFDIEGDVEALLRLGQAVDPRSWRARDLARLGKKLLTLPTTERVRQGRGSARFTGAQHSKERDRAVISYHYDVSNDFYALWLDPEMVYSCAYFASEEQDLASAQRRKLDYICRKLRLQPGERLLDIGCGWGGLVRHAAREYGADVTGITLSERQAQLARERIAAEGLGGRCRVEIADYREVPEDRAFDKLVSVGMFEHVGEEKLPEYFAKALRLLRPGGAFLNHGISCNIANAAKATHSTFSDRYVFPDGDLVAVSTTQRVAEEAGFEIRDVESLREHYALTLRQWVRGLEEHRAEARAVVDEATYRTWRLFMSASAHGFARNSLQVYQTLLVKPDRGRSGVPLTREDWYR